MLSVLSSGREEGHSHKSSLVGVVQACPGASEKPFLRFFLREMLLRSNSAAPMANFFDEMMRNFELQRNRSKSYVCAAHPRTMGTKHQI